MRVICKEWLQLVDPLWQDYTDYAQKRANIYTISPIDLLYADNKFYVRKPDFNLINADLYWLTSKMKIKSKCCNCSHKGSLEECVKHEHIGIVFQSKLHQGYTIYPKEKVHLRLKQLMKESDILILSQDQLFIYHDGNIIPYTKNIFLPLETYNIDYFGKYTRLCDKRIVKRPAGYRARCIERCDYTSTIARDRYKGYFLVADKSEFPGEIISNMDSDPEEEEIDFDIGYPKKYISKSHGRYHKDQNMAGENCRSWEESETETSDLDEDEDEEDEEKPWDEGICEDDD
jgi:hypothetical protein